MNFQNDKCYWLVSCLSDLEPSIMLISVCSVGRKEMLWEGVCLSENVIWAWMWNEMRHTRC